ncbi:MAG: methionine synthase [Anaerolineales bacterium]|nr:MAG: methionine synthase [Anaerolineales bacterium]
MNPKDSPNCRATGVGSTPHTDANAAVEFILQTFGDIPFWPQLPRRAFVESMYAQYSERLPGVRFEDEKITIQLGDGWLEEAEEFYAAFLEEDPGRFALSAEYAAGLHGLIEAGPLDGAWAVKGHVTGPISFGLQVTDQDRRPSLYDDMMRDVIVKNALRHAQWQEKELRALCPRTIVFLDEPFLSMVGSAYASLPREQVVASLEEVLSGVEGWTGAHCCANTDWSLLLETSVDILSFDAYEYAETVALYPDELRVFLDRGGVLAWGVVPSSGDATETITLEEARNVFEKALVLFERKGFDRDQLLAQSLITPACGTGTLSVPVAERILSLTRRLSDSVREEYSLV